MENKPVKVICIKCGHVWHYKGNSKHRIRCSGRKPGTERKCRSSQNDFNRRNRPKWSPKELKKDD